jgi:hypothetical protein
MALPCDGVWGNVETALAKAALLACSGGCSDGLVKFVYSEQSPSCEIPPFRRCSGSNSDTDSPHLDKGSKWFGLLPKGVVDELDDNELELDGVVFSRPPKAKKALQNKTRDAVKDQKTKVFHR